MLLLPAYDDVQGVTAAFNLNLLHRMNRELGANFHVPAFVHLALYNEEHGRIEMHLRSRWAQHVTIAKTAQTIYSPLARPFIPKIRTSTPLRISDALGRHAGLTLSRTWFDRQHYFVLGLFRREN